MAGKYQVLVYSNMVLFTEDTVSPLNVWCHYALTRKNGIITLWRDGKAVGSGTFNGVIGTSSKKKCIGSYASDSGGVGQSFNGYISYFRITKDIARWSSEFTPPTSIDNYKQGKTTN